MALEGQQRVVAHHAAAVIGHLDKLLAARFHLHADPRRSRIQRVLQQLLQHRRRTLHHLARGDLLATCSESTWIRAMMFFVPSAGSRGPQFTMLFACRGGRREETLW